MATTSYATTAATSDTVVASTTAVASATVATIPAGNFSTKLGTTEDLEVCSSQQVTLDSTCGRFLPGSGQGQSVIVR
eukprot:CAMPEP_0176347022 /NCGR_PEP_ID=MMETSP0126-20121128/6703_1 /TAXON_ID=141414 ORGANISM="Strombidinopsis acuminatum, Strain SPMC142" /NCGR_SAMPLE_ID=MMETSP0126 /ASSEMBLY_ACC=CAM_ASM_000229 /LENGTH=76 /DNA_ID=CAMNT_0017694905 /DNA_START=164 /DNA_END=394 /DNA_ORIENTATION=+